MNWHNPTLDDLAILQKSADGNSLLGNNYSAVNSFLYNLKYNSQISINDGWIFEKYFIDGKLYFSFPHNIEGNNDNLKKALSFLENESKSANEPFILRNITLQEKDLLLQINPDVEITENPELSDYIYLTEDLALLPGSKYSKKRNHINQFIKNYPDYRFELLNSSNIEKALEVEEEWLNGSLDKDLLMEKEIIKKAFENFQRLESICKMSGGLIYAENKPVAFCIASLLSSQITDIHFEKCIEPFAKAGGYSIINKEFSKTISTKYLNREEDLGIEGLRKAKLSYYPEMVLEKFSVRLF